MTSKNLLYYTDGWIDTNHVRELLEQKDAQIAALEAIISSETPIGSLTLHETWKAEKQHLMEQIAALEAELAAAREASKWIPVGERLPDTPGMYETRISLPSFNEITGLPNTVVCNGEDYYDEKGWFNNLPYTHWRELPAPPEVTP
jgi:hypothetical protein